VWLEESSKLFLFLLVICFNLVNMNREERIGSLHSKKDMEIYYKMIEVIERESQMNLKIQVWFGKGSYTF